MPDIKADQIAQPTGANPTGATRPAQPDWRNRIGKLGKASRPDG